MRNIIGSIISRLLCIPFFACLLATSAFGQTTDGALGPSCTSTFKLLAAPKTPQKFVTSWCWAATSQSVMAFNRQNIEQCELVEKVYEGLFSPPCCGVDTAVECWGFGGYPEWVFDKYAFSYSPSKNQDVRLTWTEATEEICQNRPFISLLDLINGDLHTVVVNGYRVKQGESLIRIYDPNEEDYTYESSDLFFKDQSANYKRIRDTYNGQVPRLLEIGERDAG